MKHYLSASGAAEVQKQIAAHRANLAQLRATRAARHLTIQVSCNANAAIASIRGLQFQIGGAL